MELLCSHLNNSPAPSATIFLFCFVCSGRSTIWSRGMAELVPSDGRELRPCVCWRGHGGCPCCCQVHSAFSSGMWLGGAQHRQTLPAGSCWALRWKTVYKHTLCFKQMQNFLGCHHLAHRDIYIVLLSRVSAVLFRENVPDSEHRNSEVALHRHVS